MDCLEGIIDFLFCILPILPKICTKNRKEILKNTGDEAPEDSPLQGDGG